MFLSVSHLLVVNSYICCSRSVNNIAMVYQYVTVINNVLISLLPLPIRLYTIQVISVCTSTYCRLHRITRYNTIIRFFLTVDRIYWEVLVIRMGIFSLSSSIRCSAWLSAVLDNEKCKSLSGLTRRKGGESPGVFRLSILSQSIKGTSITLYNRKMDLEKMISVFLGRSYCRWAMQWSAGEIEISDFLVGWRVILSICWVSLVILLYLEAWTVISSTRSHPGFSWRPKSLYSASNPLLYKRGFGSRWGVVSI